MSPLHNRLPDIAAAEIRSIYIPQAGGSLPIGEYAFLEWYCDEAQCDCRRVLLQVVAPANPRKILATINFGWESLDFYTRWLHGDAESAQEIKDAALDPINPQSDLAEPLLELFPTVLMADEDYVARLRRHYNMFKQPQRK